MARTEPVVLTNMCMVYDGTKILVQQRKDPDWPGLVFPGRHVEKGESFIDATIREVYEETGLTISDLHLCGVKQFTHSKGRHCYLVFLYKTNQFSGELQSSEEGEVFWIERADLDQYQLADGFEHMLPIFDDDSLSENFFFIEGQKWQFKNR